MSYTPAEELEIKGMVDVDNTIIQSKRLNMSRAPNCSLRVNPVP